MGKDCVRGPETNFCGIKAGGRQPGRFPRNAARNGRTQVYAQVNRDGTLRLINHLDVHRGVAAEDIQRRLDEGDLAEKNIVYGAAAGSDRHYATHVRDVEPDTSARYNADLQRLHETSGSAGRPMVFAVRLDIFPVEVGIEVFYVGTNDTTGLTRFRRHVLSEFPKLPVACELLRCAAMNMTGSRNCYQISKSRSYQGVLGILCRVFHQDHIVRKCTDCLELEYKM